MTEIWIPGLPATFATKREGQWKSDIVLAVQREMCNHIDETGVIFDFILPLHGVPSNQTKDIDNLCEPVFSVLVHKLGWFKGKRSNIRWWSACKTHGEQTGLKLKISAGTNRFEELYGHPFYVFQGPDSYYKTYQPTMVRKPRPPQPEDRFIVSLEFGGNKVNIGDISTGKVKGVIDSLYLVLGGSKGQPEDWRINQLYVEKEVLGIKEGSVEVKVWRHRDSDII